MQLHALALIALLAVSPTGAFIAWSGWNCDGNEGSNVPCDGGCWGSFDGRHSFIAGSPGNSHCVAFYVEAGCGQRFNFTGQSS